MAAFAQFGSELDLETQKQLARGKRLTEILKQPQFQPLSESLEFLSIYAVTSGLMDDVPLESFQRFETELHSYVKRGHPKVIDSLSSGNKPSPELLEKLQKIVLEFKKGF